MVTFTAHSAVFPPCVVTVTVADPASTASTTALLLSSVSVVTLTTAVALLSHLTIASPLSGVAVSSFFLSVPDDTFNIISVSDNFGALNSGVTGSPASSACTDAFVTVSSLTVSVTFSGSVSSTGSVASFGSASSTDSAASFRSASSTGSAASFGSASSTGSAASVCSSCSSARVIILQFSTGTRFDINIAAHINARILLCISFSSLDFFLCMNHHNIFGYRKIYFFA